jgi:hypothetical protein
MLIRFSLLAATTVLIGTAATIFISYKKEISSARAAVGGSLVADTDAGPIEYAEHGSGIPLLSIHGAGGGFDQGLSLAAEIAGVGFRIIPPSPLPAAEFAARQIPDPN